MSDDKKNDKPKESKKYINKIFWIDQKVNSDYNKKCQVQLKEKFPDMELQTFEDFQKGFEEIKNTKKFEFIYLIISGLYFESYVENFDKDIESFTHIPITIIFTSKYFQDVLLQKKIDKENQLKEKTFKAIRNPIYNLGYMEIDFKKIIKFIEEFEVNLDEKYEDIINFDRERSSRNG